MISGGALCPRTVGLEGTKWGGKFCKAEDAAHRHPEIRIASQQDVGPHIPAAHAQEKSAKNFYPKPLVYLEDLYRRWHPLLPHAGTSGGKARLHDRQRGQSVFHRHPLDLERARAQVGRMHFDVLLDPNSGRFARVPTN